MIESIYNVFDAALKFLKENNIPSPHEVLICDKRHKDVTFTWDNNARSYGEYCKITATIKMDGVVTVYLEDNSTPHIYRTYDPILIFNFHNIASNKYIKSDGRFYLVYSEDDKEYVGLCLDHPYLSHLDIDQDVALQGIKCLINTLENN